MSNDSIPPCQVSIDDQNREISATSHRDAGRTIVDQALIVDDNQRAAITITGSHLRPARWQRRIGPVTYPLGILGAQTMHPCIIPWPKLVRPAGTMQNTAATMLHPIGHPYHTVPWPRQIGGHWSPADIELRRQRRCGAQPGRNASLKDQPTHRGCPFGDSPPHQPISAQRPPRPKGYAMGLPPGHRRESHDAAPTGCRHGPPHYEGPAPTPGSRR